MARYTGPVCKLCRREGAKMYLKGERCYTDKCGFSKRQFAPGQHGQGRKKLSEYGIQLREKQKAKRIYGVLEKQFRRYFGLADRQKGITGENLLRILERRLDNVVYKLGLAASRVEARQLVNHGHFTLNGKKVNIPSLLVKIGDKVAVAEKSRQSEKFKVLLEEAGKKGLPGWLEYDADNATGSVVRFPTREEIDSPIAEHLIVELYSK